MKQSKGFVELKRSPANIEAELSEAGRSVNTVTSPHVNDLVRIGCLMSGTYIWMLRECAVDGRHFECDSHSAGARLSAI